MSWTNADGTRMVSIAVPADVLAGIDRAAKQARMTRADFISQALAKQVEVVKRESASDRVFRQLRKQLGKS